MGTTKKHRWKARIAKRTQQTRRRNKLTFWRGGFALHCRRIFISNWLQSSCLFLDESHCLPLFHFVFLVFQKKKKNTTTSFCTRIKPNYQKGEYTNDLLVGRWCLGCRFVWCLVLGCNVLRCVELSCVVVLLSTFGFVCVLLCGCENQIVRENQTFVSWNLYMKHICFVIGRNLFPTVSWLGIYWCWREIDPVILTRCN